MHWVRSPESIGWPSPGALGALDRHQPTPLTPMTPNVSKGTKHPGDSHCGRNPFVLRTKSVRTVDEIRSYGNHRWGQTPRYFKNPSAVLQPSIGRTSRILPRYWLLAAFGKCGVIVSTIFFQRLSLTAPKTPVDIRVDPLPIRG